MWLHKFIWRAYCVFLSKKLKSNEFFFSFQIDFVNKVYIDLDPFEEIIEIASGKSHNILLTSIMFNK